MRYGLVVEIVVRMMQPGAVAVADHDDRDVRGQALEIQPPGEQLLRSAGLGHFAQIHHDENAG